MKPIWRIDRFWRVYRQDDLLGNYLSPEEKRGKKGEGNSQGQ